MENFKSEVAERLMKYVQVDTQSDPHSTSFPSTEKQKNLSRILVEELKQLGLVDAELDEHGYVFATIQATTGFEHLPTVCFCSHVDTAPDCSGTDVKPILHKNYDGSDIILPDDPTQIITTSEHPYLIEKIGDDLITASGKTLLGADDKAGVAIIMDFASYMMKNPDVNHGKIRILFTPDEEVGRGVEKLDMKKLGADFGYTLDGGELGCFECDTFSADACTITFHGVSAHPGYAKNKLVNAIKVASHFIDLLPKDSWSPETTYEQEGFVHPVGIEGIMEKTTVSFIVRSFETKVLADYEQRLESYAQQAVAAFPKSRYEISVKEQYRNMKEILVQNPKVMNYGEEAIKNLGIKLQTPWVRGGTDGSRLSFMGLPCPNIFTGEMAIHSKHEYVSVQDMQKAVAVCVEICKLITQD